MKYYIYIMKFCLRHLILYLFTAFSCSISFAQKHVIDSMSNVLKTQKEDTGRVNTLNNLSSALWRVNKYDTSKLFADSAQSLAEKIAYKKGIADALVNLGVIYDEQGYYPKAQDYYFKALAIQKEIGKNSRSETTLGYLGITYGEQGDLNKAMDYSTQALNVAKEEGNKHAIGSFLANIGLIYDFQGNHKKAIETDSESYAVMEETGDRVGAAGTLNNIGNIYEDTGNFPKALDYYFKALEITRAIHKMNYVATNLNNIGQVYSKQKKYNLAKAYLDSSMTVAQTIGDKEIIKNNYNIRTRLDTVANNFKQALRDYLSYTAYRDSLINESNTKKTVETEMQFDFKQTQAKQKAEQDKKDAIVQAETKRQKVVTYSVSIGMILVLLLAALILRGYRQKQRANLLLEEKNKTIAEQKQKVDNAFRELHEKHAEISDSINYAKRIQQALFREEEYVTPHLPEHFILFKPKNVVSGDFYWGYEKEKYWYIAAIDCTGHGVPGAFLTMLGTALLNEICASANLLSTAEVLGQLRDKIIKDLGGRGDVKDGMDISFCRINMETKEVQWSGANNSLWYISNGELKEVSPDKQPIGYQEGQKAFTNHNLKLNKGDIIYLFTDGYADQFGGPKGKKFKYKPMQETMKSISSLAMKEQKQKLSEVFENWKGKLEQTDDVCVIGIKI
jgi:serine phosphatase RsbU (regulator of sigma subunit)